MNKVIQMGRLTKDPEVRYGGANNTCIARFSIAVDRRRKAEGQPDADFFNVTALGKQGEFVEKYLKKGTKVALDGELRNDNYQDKNGKMVYRTVILVNTIEFAESKRSQNMQQGNIGDTPEGFMNIDGLEEELPFA